MINRTQIIKSTGLFMRPPALGKAVCQTIQGIRVGLHVRGIDHIQKNAASLRDNTTGGQINQIRIYLRINWGNIANGWITFFILAH
ncbi:hypothetical protein [Comamonas sp. NoAH]|uniref:hypothetical protein n=1 Tax=Comamonas halotolerans TaxID=3041496 RepID=UPI0024E1333F|nr:hypothetical protein [Comamonas sp. NoAH]